MLLGLSTRVQVFWSDVRDRIIDEEGAIATEYVLLLVFIAAAIIGGVTIFVTGLGSKYEEVCGAISGTACP